MTTYNAELAEPAVRQAHRRQLPALSLSSLDLARDDSEDLEGSKGGLSVDRRNIVSI